MASSRCAMAGSASGAADALPGEALRCCDCGSHSPKEFSKTVGRFKQMILSDSPEAEEKLERLKGLCRLREGSAIDGGEFHQLLQRLL